MRTTVTLDVDTEALLRQQMALRGISFKAALNEAIRQALKQTVPHAKRRRYKVRTFSSGFQPGIDGTQLNQLSDQFEVEDYLRRSRKRELGDRS